MNRPTRRLGFEGLESRRLLAGNVTVSVFQGDLVVRGDNVANSLEIVQVAPQTYRVTGVGGTRLNGGTVPLVRSGVNDDVLVHLLGGNDRVVVGLASASTFIPGDLIINGGTGADTAITRQVRANAASVNLGFDNENDVDTIIANNSVFRTTATLSLGGGNDRIDIFNCRVTGLLKIGLNAGHDSATIDTGRAGSVELRCGHGDDTGRFKGTLAIDGDVFADGGPGLDTGAIDPNATVTVGGTETFINFEN